ncbi:hypothetical protein BDP27DRAFT_1416506 [Rhodocollybia butyracea]|uniref:Uncharacterized protein n=1 Tax=Rhodocollybia butyracea TaxID=206335 RepID=A0A9P5Q2B8_9AGAR|nr:hypothetical protein BDP27DRAFT_1416506 [Rhodocollybia butyracea]
MQYPLLFTVIANSLLDVYSLPMESHAGPSNEVSTATGPSTQFPTVTFIDGTTGDDLEGGPNPEPSGTHYAMSISRPINRALRRGPYDDIVFKNLYNPLPELSYIEVTGVPGCTKANPCPGWMARGPKPQKATWYVGIINGKPGPDRFSGRAPDAIETATDMQKFTTRTYQSEWDKHNEVFKTTFMVPQVTIVIPAKPHEKEELTKALNGALNRDSKDPIIYKGQYAKVPEPPVQDPNSYWVYFKLVRGDKRCQVKTPCFGCIVLEWGIAHVFIARKGTDLARLERIGVYLGFEENNLLAGLTLEIMEKQVEYWSRGSGQ